MLLEVDDEIAKRFGLDWISPNEFFRAIEKCNAFSHVVGCISELSFATAAKKLGYQCRKMDDMDRGARYDYELSGLDLPKTLTVECKTADEDGKFNVSFRDGREHIINNQIVPSTHRHKSHRFDYTAVIMVNRTGQWTDIKYVKFDDLPTLKITNRNRKSYQAYSEETQRLMQEELLASTFCVFKLPHFDKLEDVVRDFKNETNRQPTSKTAP